MANFARHLRSLRQQAGLTQQELAEKLHVTRQAVSNWENGKTQPDIQMLQTLAAQLEVPVELLIYGRMPVQACEKKRDVRAYRIGATVAGAILIATAIVLIVWYPAALEQAKRYHVGAMLLLRGVVMPVQAAAAVVCLCALVSTAADIHIRMRSVRFILLGLGICMAALTFGILLCAAMGSNFNAALSLFSRLVVMWYRMPYLAALPAALFYFGLIRR
jgi:transcriptional regulator with XRE-family HTH domain